MPETVIWRTRDLAGFKAGTCKYDESPWIEQHATPEQEQVIADLNASVVPHSWQGDRQVQALVHIPGYPHGQAAWVSPDGTVKETDMSPGYHCYGNPTTAHCIAVGYCRRNRACND